MTDSEQSKLIISGAVAAHELPIAVHDGVPEDADGGAETELRRELVPAASHGLRLDLALAAIVPEFSRNYLQQLIGGGVVQLRGLVVTKTSTKVKAGDELAIELRPTLQSQAFKPEAMVLDIVFEDPYLMVINKPAGLVVHPAPGNWSGTLLNGLLAYDAQASFLPRAGIVHRLDKDTSGLMVVARQRQVMDQLVDLIAARNVSREYIALAHEAWQGAKTREVDAAIGRDTRNRLRMAVVDLEKNSGKTASTVVALLHNGERHCLVKCKLHTGRTHQIRVHMAFLGHPLVSDELYGGAAGGGLHRQALHACRLAFKHPVTGAKMEFRSPPPADLLAAIADLGLIYN
ncbi:RluA family pseudouridine synthase [Polaromonas sp.]|uniref:RluA family pseudouridine synthase n=1 Tax=Polaromonas sp. TaxID=1869339 RepID=UPI0017F346CB|nr:RluA family pseudouridine synthase [Polaromonas sp.]NMM07041.1 RluA family pseudouridine synthase [Polaromonas sp.]